MIIAEIRETITEVIEENEIGCITTDVSKINGVYQIRFATKDKKKRLLTRFISEQELLQVFNPHEYLRMVIEEMVAQWLGEEPAYAHLP